MLRSRSIIFRCAAAILLSLGLATAPAAQVSVYHGVTATTHQSNWTTLSGQGYRPLALSVVLPVLMVPVTLAVLVRDPVFTSPCVSV